jgi:hypothetical protein
MSPRTAAILTWSLFGLFVAIGLGTLGLSNSATIIAGSYAARPCPSCR